MADRYGFTTIATEMDDDGLLTVTLNRPERRNSLDTVMHTELAELFVKVCTDREIRAILLTGAGRDFTVGADFNVMQDNIDAGGYPDGHPGLMIESAAIIRSIMAVRPPIVAAVNGNALGIGATLALFSDIVFMADDARIGDPHVKAGMVAGDGGAVIWPALLGVHRAKEFLMLGTMVSGPDAERIGLVNHCVPAAELLDQARATALALAQGPSIAIQFTKRLINKDLEARITQVMDLSLALEALTLDTSDYNEAIASFLEKRPPTYGPVYGSEGTHK
ncbi:MAG: enoyl-CoA hydratase-related protein [Acidimicrobiales bacterium]